MIPCVVGLICVILMLGPGSGVNHTGWLIKTHGVEIAEDKLNQIYTEAMTKKKIKESLNLTKIEECRGKTSFLKTLKIFNKEIKLVVLAVVTLAICNPALYATFSVLIGSKNLSNTAAVLKTKKLLTFDPLI